jgi:hypothetical protein
MRGFWSEERYQQEIALTRETLESLAGAGAGHWGEYLTAWSPR